MEFSLILAVTAAALGGWTLVFRRRISAQIFLWLELIGFTISALTLAFQLRPDQGWWILFLMFVPFIALIGYDAAEKWQKGDRGEPPLVMVFLIFLVILILYLTAFPEQPDFLAPRFIIGSAVFFHLNVSESSLDWWVFMK